MVTRSSGQPGLLKTLSQNKTKHCLEMTHAPITVYAWLDSFRRKLSSKSKKWKSIFNLGRSGSDSKSKLSRNGSVFVRGQRLSGENQHCAYRALVCPEPSFTFDHCKLTGTERKLSDSLEFSFSKMMKIMMMVMVMVMINDKAISSLQSIEI